MDFTKCCDHLIKFIKVRIQFQDYQINNYLQKYHTFGSLQNLHGTLISEVQVSQRTKLHCTVVTTF